MAVSSTQLLRVIQQFRRYYDRHFSELLSRTGLSMREIHVVLFLANHPAHDTARDVTELRGLAKSQVSAAVDLLAARELLRRQPDKADRPGDPSGADRCRARPWPGRGRSSRVPAWTRCLPV